MRRQPNIVVLGSSNTDMVATAPRFPGAGETVLGNHFIMNQGGKGANQAVAAARLGACVKFIGRLGTDVFGDMAVAALASEGIDTSRIIRDPNVPSGIALITVSAETGNNCIVVAPGANAALSPEDIDANTDIIRAADVLICQLETPLETITVAVAAARAAGVKTILNPAPAQPLPSSLLPLISILTPNETESQLLVDDTAASPAEASAILRARGVATVITTLGSAGAHISTAEGDSLEVGHKVAAVVDTTAAGDCFTGALAVYLAEGKSLSESVSFANAAAALSVTRAGAQTSLPERDAVESFIHAR